MSKLGRNDLCFCGSGKKYKKCHALVPTPRPAKSSVGVIAKVPKNVSSIEFDHPGMSGFRCYLGIQPYWNDQSNPLNLGGIEGLPGLYKVVFTFSRPGFSLYPERSTHLGGNLQGDSHLTVLIKQGNRPEEFPIKIETKYGNFTFRVIPNEKGYVGRIQIDSLQAENFGEAELKAFHALAPVLSNLSACLDIPMHIYQVDIIELRTGAMKAGTISPFTEITVTGQFLHPLHPDCQKYASFYREAVNCNNPNYQFLCFYKIIEGLQKRQNRRIIEARERAEEIPPQPKEFIPTSPRDQEEWVNSLFPIKKKFNEMDLESILPKESLGRKLGDIVQELKDIRDEIAHGLLDYEEERKVISIDDAIEVQKVYRWLPLTKCIARYLMMKEFPGVFQIS